MPQTTTTSVGTSSAQIRAQALYIVSTIVGDGLDTDTISDDASLLSFSSYYASLPSAYHAYSVSVDKAAISLYANAITNLEFTRSFALITRQVIQELQACDGRLALEFRNEIMDLAAANFVVCWMKKFRGQVNDTPHDPDDDSPPLDSVSRLPEITAFLGDLFSLGLLPAGTTQALLDYLCSGIRDADDLRGLLLLLTRLNSPDTSRRSNKTRQSLDPLVLRKCHRLVLENRGRLQDGPTEDFYAIIKTLDEMIDSILSRKTKEPFRERYRFASFQTLSLSSIETLSFSSSRASTLSSVVV